MSERRASVVLFLIGFFLFAEFFSWVTASWPGPCLVQEAHDAGTHGCPAFFGGVGILIERLFEFAEQHDKGIVALFTVILATSTIGLWLATVGLYIGGDRQFKLARDEFISTHRPKIRIKHVWMAGGDICHDEPIIVRVVCVNHGTTDAIITDFGMQYRVVKEGGSLPPDHNIPQTFIQGEFRLEPGISLPLPNFSGTITDEEHFAIRNHKARLYCLGFLHYLDGAKRLRTTAFCRVLAVDPSQKVGRFIVATDEPDYEYED